MRILDGSGRVLGEEVEVARSARARARGLLGRGHLEESSLLVLQPARQVHTIGMRFPIDVAFCDRDGVVVHLVQGLKPWRVTRWVGSARMAIEAARGGLEGLRVGDRLTVEED